MVWKANFLVGDEPMTLEGFIDKIATMLRVLPPSDIQLFRFSLCYFKNPKDAFQLRFYLDRKHFPQHFVFGNFQCLRCGLCCKNYECVPVDGEQIDIWESEGREDILQYVVVDRFPIGIYAEIYPRSITGCPLCRKVRGKPYYYCKIQSAKGSLPICQAYLCSKSVLVAHLNFKDVNELIDLIGIEGYYSLIERDWGDDFDYSKCSVKTHKKIGTSTSASTPMHYA